MENDITMCSNKKCPLRLSCYRFTTKPTNWQSYGEFSINDSGNCEHFMANTTPNEVSFPSLEDAKDFELFMLRLTHDASRTQLIYGLDNYIVKFSLWDGDIREVYPQYLKYKNTLCPMKKSVPADET